MLPAWAAKAREIAHAGLAWVGYAVTAIGAAATTVSALIMAFGGHVSAIDVEAKMTLAGAVVTLLSKFIDSGNNALVARAAVKAAAAAAAPASNGVDATVARVLAALGSALQSVAQPAAPAPPAGG